MNIELRRNHGFYLVFEAENVKVEEDIETREYPKDQDGKSIITLNPKRDISNDSLNMIVTLLDDMIYYREANYDSSELIKRLFDKLPEDVCINLLQLLENDYKP